MVQKTGFDWVSFVNKSNYFVYTKQLVAQISKNGSLLFKLLDKVPEMYRHLPKAYQDDLNLLLYVLKLDVNLICYASCRLKNNQLVQLYLVNFDRERNLRLDQFPEILLGTQDEVVHKLSIAKQLILDLPTEFFSNISLVKQLVMTDYLSLLYLPKGILDDKEELVMNLLAWEPRIFEFLGESLRANPEIATIAIREYPFNVKSLAPCLQTDSSMIIKFIRFAYENYAYSRYDQICKSIRKEMFHDVDVVIEGLICFRQYFVKYIPKENLKNLSFVLSLLQVHGMLVQYLPREMKSHPKLVEFMIDHHIEYCGFLSKKSVKAIGGQKVFEEVFAN